MVYDSWSAYPFETPAIGLDLAVLPEAAVMGELSGDNVSGSVPFAGAVQENVRSKGLRTLLQNCGQVKRSANDSLDCDRDRRTALARHGDHDRDLVAWNHAIGNTNAHLITSHFTRRENGGHNRCGHSADRHRTRQHRNRRRVRPGASLRDRWRHLAQTSCEDRHPIAGCRGLAWGYQPSIHIQSAALPHAAG